MKAKSLKSRLMYLSLLISVITILFNYWSVPFLSAFFTQYFNLFSAAVIVLSISRLVGISNKMDFKMEVSNRIYVSNMAIIILAIELIISLNFQYFNTNNDRVFVYALCLTPSFGFILSRPMLRLNYLEAGLERMEHNGNIPAN